MFVQLEICDFFDFFYGGLGYVATRRFVGPPWDPMNFLPRGKLKLEKRPVSSYLP